MISPFERILFVDMPILQGHFYGLEPTILQGLSAYSGVSQDGSVQIRVRQPRCGLLYHRIGAK